MSATKSELKPEEKAPETLTERVERELATLREFGLSGTKSLPTITMSTFEQLSPRSRVDFCKAGGKLTDDPPPPKKPIPEGAIVRSRFDAMSHPEKMKFIKAGGKLVDDEDVEDGAPGNPGTLLTRAAFRDLPMLEQVNFIDAGGTITD